jgi:hypothetical protein
MYEIYESVIVMLPLIHQQMIVLIHFRVLIDHNWLLDQSMFSLMISCYWLLQILFTYIASPTGIRTVILLVG